jgi:VIT1/CCC1 family predicted Fe2+/Mn2+ transporter
MVGGVLGAITDALGLPLAIGLVGLALFVAGTVTAGALAVHYSRATGQSVPRSIWLGIRTAVRWLYFFMP